MAKARYSQSAVFTIIFKVIRVTPDANLFISSLNVLSCDCHTSSKGSLFVVIYSIYELILRPLRFIYGWYACTRGRKNEKMSAKNRFLNASLFLLVAMLFAVFPQRIARLLHTLSIASEVLIIRTLQWR